MATRRLIVNADDFGQDVGINRGVIAAHERGIVTSASLMVRWPAAAEAAAYVRAHPRLDLGLHLDFGEWAYRDETWMPLYRVVPTEDPTAVAAELSAQLDRFRSLVGRDPSHLDSHQHVHRDEPLRALALRAAERLGVPLRDRSPLVQYRGHYYGQSGKGHPVPEMIGVDTLLCLLAGLPEGVTELGCHPGLNVAIETTYRDEREREVATLCDPRVRAAIEQHAITLCSFRHLDAD